MKRIIKGMASCFSACWFALAVMTMLFSGCKKEDEMDFNAPKYSATVKLLIEKQNTSVRSRYTLKVFSAVIEKNDYGTPFFYIKGKDSSSNALIVISGSVPSSSASKFNLAVTEGESTTLYKDCNHSFLKMSEGTDSKGGFTRISFPYNLCMTATMTNTRTSAEPYFSLISDPITIYNQE